MAERERVEEDIYIVLSPYERGLVHALQMRKEGSGPVNWKVLAKDVKMSESFLKALIKVELPKDSNNIPLSSLNLS
jgi:hypothetical protein